MKAWPSSATPQPIVDAHINYIVLGVALVLESGAWWIAFKEFAKSKGDMGTLEAVRRSKDPAVFTVLFEDSAAIAGLIVAAVGIGLSDALGEPMWDGVGSIVIGAVLAGTAALLAYECKGLLIGEGAGRGGRPRRPAPRRRPRRGGAHQRGPDHASRAARRASLNLSLDFEDRLSSAEVEKTISGPGTGRSRAAHPEITRVFIEAQSRAGHRRDRQESRPDQTLKATPRSAIAARVNVR